MAKRATKKKGVRVWKTSDRKRQGSYLKQAHALAAQIKKAEQEKGSGGIEKLSLGQLEKIIDQLIQSGTSKSAPIIFSPTCAGEKVEIKLDRRFENDAPVDVILVR